MQLTQMWGSFLKNKEQATSERAVKASGLLSSLPSRVCVAGSGRGRGGGWETPGAGIDRPMTLTEGRQDREGGQSVDF